MHAGADLAQVPQQDFSDFVHVPEQQQPAARTVTANIPANIALFILAPFLLVRVSPSATRDSTVNRWGE